MGFASLNLPYPRDRLWATAHTLATAHVRDSAPRRRHPAYPTSMREPSRFGRRPIAHSLSVESRSEHNNTRDAGGLRRCAPDPPDGIGMIAGRGEGKRCAARFSPALP
jgi:hypothetical protein